MQTAHEGKPFFKRWPVWLRWTLLAVLIAALGSGGYAFYAVRNARAASTQQQTVQTAVARQGNLVIEASGTGTLASSAEANLAFQTSGQLKSVSVKVGDAVTAGQALAELDNSSQQLALAEARQNLLELTSPAAIAAAQQAVAADQQAVYNGQVALNNLLYLSTNEAAIQNAQASMLLAESALNRAKAAYNNVAGDADTSLKKAAAYQDLYAAQLTYNSAVSTYNLYTGKPNQVKVDSARATLALAKATLAEAQTLVAALTGGTVPADATGSGYDALQKARQAVQTAQEDLDATRLTAPISGTVLAVNNQVGDTVGSGTFITIADLSQAQIQIYMDENDWNNIKAGYAANVTFDALPDQVFTGKVTQVYPELVAVAGNSVVEGLVQLDLSNDAGASDPIGLPLGVSASVDVISAQVENAVLVPVQALHELSAGNYAVFIMANRKPTLRQVEVGLQDATYAEIKSGLKAGDVVTTGLMETSK